jgi:hypothetical protein
MMIQKLQLESRAQRVPSRKSMTPARYKALSPLMRRAYDQKAKIEMDEFDRKMLARQAANNKRIVDALVESVAMAPHIEWEVVSNYLSRTGQLLISDPKGRRHE